MRSGTRCLSISGINGGVGRSKDEDEKCSSSIIVENFLFLNIYVIIGLDTLCLTLVIISSYLSKMSGLSLLVELGALSSLVSASVSLLMGLSKINNLKFEKGIEKKISWG